MTGLNPRLVMELTLMTVGAGEVGPTPARSTGHDPRKVPGSGVQVVAGGVTGSVGDDARKTRTCNGVPRAQPTTK